MYPGISRAEQNLMLLQSMIPSSERFYVWCYQSTGELLAASCPDDLRKVLDQAFRGLGAHQTAVSLGQTIDAPRIIGSSIGMQWAVTREEREQDRLLFVCGPVFFTPPDEKSIRAALPENLNGIEQRGWIRPLCDRLSDLSVMSYAVFSRYVLMVHNTLTGRQLGLEALERTRPASENVQIVQAGERNRLGVYQAEQALLEMVRTGNINYHTALQNSFSLSSGVPVQGSHPLQQMRINLIVFVTLVSRAAMEGGLSPEVAYPLGDSYIQAAIDSRDSGEIYALTTAMYHDFIYRVHHIRSGPNYSHAIQKCCDYIELSLDRKIRTADLAALVGYTEYYLTGKFRKETGKTVSAYIREAKIQRAKILLETTSLSVEELAEKLAFNTTSYFIQSFRETTGITPAQYRKQRQPVMSAN